MNIDRERRVVDKADGKMRFLLSAFPDPIKALSEACLINANLCERVRDLEMQLAKRSIPDELPEGF
jgi:hypothetical protein